MLLPLSFLVLYAIFKARPFKNSVGVESRLTIVLLVITIIWVVMLVYKGPKFKLNFQRQNVLDLLQHHASTIEKIAAKYNKGDVNVMNKHVSKMIKMFNSSEPDIDKFNDARQIVLESIENILVSVKAKHVETIQKSADNVNTISYNMFKTVSEKNNLGLTAPYGHNRYDKKLYVQKF